MKERPILFSAPMVRAILAGTKTQTRRVVNARKSPDYGCHMSPGEIAGDEHPERLCFYGQPGDRLWVRETWARDDEDGALMYRADVGRDMNADAWEQGRLEGVPRYRWRPSIHMPRWASRITLEITGVRVERLQDISEADATAEGVMNWMVGPTSPAQDFRALWESINGPGSWAANPWVWVLEFRRVDDLAQGSKP